MGSWCYATRQDPETYNSLSRLERDEFAKAAEDLRKKGWN